VWQSQSVRRHDRRRRSGIALTREDVEDDVGGMDALGDRLGAGGFHRRQSVSQHGGENGDHLTIAIVGPSELAPHLLQRRRRHPVLERSAVAQRAGLARQHRHIMPRIVGYLAATVFAGMLGDDAAILPEDDAFGVGVDLDRTANRAGAHRVFVVVEPHQARLRHGGWLRVESIEATAIGNELGPLLLENLPDGLLGAFGMRMSLGVNDASVHEPSVQLIVGLEPQPRREEALADKADLVFDLALLPTRGRRAGDGIDEVVRAHLQEAAIVLPVLAGEDRLHRSLHIIVDAARACALEKREGAVMRVEHHFLGLARIGPHEHHPAVAEADMRDLHRRRHAVHHDDLVAPVELVGLARRERQRHIGARRLARVLAAPGPGVAPHGVVAALVAKRSEVLE